MNIAADTNLLVRVLVGDDKKQSASAERELKQAKSVAISVSALCELAWVLRESYNSTAREVFDAISRLIAAKNVVVNRPAVDAGLRMLKSGGDFADGVIAYEGQWLGADEFVSFDRSAVKRLNALQHTARLLEEQISAPLKSISDLSGRTSPAHSRTCPNRATSSPRIQSRFTHGRRHDQRNLREGDSI